MAADLVAVENRLWAAADQLWANTGLKPSEFSTPVLGLIFLRFADKRFVEQQAAFKKKKFDLDELEAIDYQAEGVLYLPEEARFSHLLTLTEGDNLGRAINSAMALVEAHNEELKGVLPRAYNKLPTATLVELLRLLAPLDLEGDAFGKVYEYFLGNFAMKEGQKGGVFYTPTSIVRLIVEILQPFHGRIFDPACGSGGMFVQSAAFVQRHHKSATRELTVFGTEKASDTVKLGKMNLAVHGLSGDIRESNTYHEDPHAAVDNKGVGRFDFVMANPPFNVSGVDKDRLKDDRRFPLGLPSTDNANYLWIQLFHSALNAKGRAGFVMANSAGDARGSELEIRKKLIQSGAVDVIVSVGSNFFYTVTLPCTLWFFDKGKPKTRKDKVLFLDARPFFRQVTRAMREFTPEQLEFLANVVRLYRGEAPEFESDSRALLAERFPESAYRDVAGLCKVATLVEIEAQGWSLNPGRYVGVGERAADEFDFTERLEELNEELELLNAESKGLEGAIAANLVDLLGAVITTGWRSVKISQLGRIVTGKTPPSAKPELFGEAHPFITPTDIDGVSRTVFTERFVSDEGIAAFKNQAIPMGAVCFVCIGATIGKMCIAARQSLTNQQVNSIVVDEEVHDSKFVYYALKRIASNVKRLAGGAATPIISKGSFSDIEVAVAPLEQQRRIASILSAYDNLIENNTRRIAILEEMARRIYEEWFVRFRFPGHENVRMVESELGFVPEGWEVAPMEKVCARITDGSHLSPKSVEVGKPMASVKDMHDWGIRLTSCRRIAEDDYENLVRNDCKPRLNDVLIAKDGSYLKHTFVVDEEVDLVVLSSIAILRPNGRLHPNQLAMYLRLPDVASRMKGYVSGVAIPRIVLRDFRQFPLLLAPMPIQNAWANVCDPMLSLCRNLVRQNERLCVARDLLLPKLISGELDVSKVPEPESA